MKPYVERGKTDVADAEAICEAVARPTIRFFAVKTPEQQAVLMPHKTRDLLVGQRTGLINSLRAHLGEYGIISSKAPGGVTALMKVLHEAQGQLPPHAASGVGKWGQSAGSADPRLAPYRRYQPPTGDHLGFGPITGAAIAATVPDATMFRSGRQFAAWLGRTPRPQSSGRKEQLGGISKQGDGCLRRLLVVGATAVMRMVRKDAGRHTWGGAVSYPNRRRSRRWPSPISQRA